MFWPAFLVALSPATVPPGTAVPLTAVERRERELLKAMVEIPTVEGRGQVPHLVNLISRRLRSAGIADIIVKPHDGTQSMIVRWPARVPGQRKPILLMAHLDVVEARRDDWKHDPFEFREAHGYYWGRGTADNKAGVAAIIASLSRLKTSGFEPSRDIIALFTGDEETNQNGARLAASDWKPLIDAEFALNADIGSGTVHRDGRPETFTIQVAEKTYANYIFRTVNRGGHSARPRPDNAIYQLAAALKSLEEYRFTPMLNEATQAYFQGVVETDKGAYGATVAAWLRDLGNMEHADLVEANAPGFTRTRCVATQLSAGHAPNALPQTAEAIINCRIFPGIKPDAVRQELQAIAGKDVKVEELGNVVWSDPSPLRADVMRAYSKAVRRRFPGAPVIPAMSTSATDAVFTRAAGIPTYGVAGIWSIAGEQLGTHGMNERIPVRSFHDQIDMWAEMLRELAG